MSRAISYRSSMLGIFIFCSLLYSLANASGQQNDMASIKHEHCEEGNNLENTFCISRELEESNSRLNVVYGTLMNALASPESLRRAQRAWIAFRDAECMFKNRGMQGGSGYNFSVDLCLMRLTEQRISALEDIRPCNGCVAFKDDFYSREFRFPERKRIPASGKP